MYKRVGVTSKLASTPLRPHVDFGWAWSRCPGNNSRSLRIVPHAMQAYWKIWPWGPEAMLLSFTTSCLQLAH